jgi:signal transduction histidine kinase
MIGKDAPRISKSSTDATLELERVLEAWNSATDRLQATHEALRGEVRRLTEELEVKNRELARKNRLADLGQMASHVADEVRNGLAPMKLYMSLLRRRLDDDPGSLDVMDKVESGCIAVEATVSDLLNFTSDRDPIWRLFSVMNLVQEVCESVAPQLEAQHIDIDLDVAAGLRLLADRDMLRRAVLNLVLNSLDAMPDGGQLVVTAVEGVGVFELEIADSGDGIDQRNQDRIFEPFFTTKSEGTGLGLAIVYRIAEVHGGKVEAINCPEGGAAITIRIPNRALEAAA